MSIEWGLLAAPFAAGLLVLATHVPLGIEVLRRGIIFIDLAIAQVASLGVVAADLAGWQSPWSIQAAAGAAALAGALLLTWSEKRWPDLQEALIGLLFVTAAAAGILLLANHPHGGEHLKDLLAGQVLWVGWGQLAPAAGLYDYSGFFALADQSPSGIVGEVFRNDTLVYSGVLNGTGASTGALGASESFSGSAFFQAGDTLSYRIRRMSSYVEDALVKDEKIVHVGHISKWSLWHLILFGLVLLPAFGAGLILLAIAYVRYKSVELAVTTKRVIVKHGFIRRQTVEMNLSKVESIQVSQSLLGRMLDYGTLVIAGTGASHAPIDGVAEPLAFRRAFVEAQDAAPRSEA